jgi:hypothetical protein
MKQLLIACVVVVAASTAASARAALLSWDATADFAASNPNDAWSYGWMNGSNFTRYTSETTDVNSIRWAGNLAGDGNPAVGKNTSSSQSYGIAPGQLYLHPGPYGEASVVRWTAPTDFNGTVEITGQFYPGDSGIMQTAVVLNNNWTTLAWHSPDAGTFSLTTSVTAENTIDFAVYGAYYSGSTPLAATITAVPEPGMLALIATGLVGIAACMRRKQK